MKRPTGEIDVNVAPTETIKRMKETVESIMGIAMNEYQLIFEDKILNDGMTLKQNGLRNGVMIVQVPIKSGRLLT